MENQSFFNKVEQMKKQKVESQESSKEQMYDEVRSEIIDIKNKKQEYSDLYEKVKSEKGEFSDNREGYKNALKEVLAIFENEEAKTMLSEQNIDGVKDFVSEHSDTNEAENLSSSDSLVKENLQNLRDMKTEILNVLGVENPDSKSLRDAMSSLQWAISRMDRELFDLSVDTPEGREAWSIRYPTGVYHEETSFEKGIKEKESQIRETYHDLGDAIDSIELETFREYNITNPNDTLSIRENYKEGRHIISRSPLYIENDEVNFHFGGGYSSLVYKIKQNSQGKLSLSRAGEYKAILPDGYVKIFNEKLRQVDDNFKATFENI